MYGDAFLLAERHELRLMVIQMKFKLVDCRNDGSVGKDVVQLEFGGIGHADSLDFA